MLTLQNSLFRYEPYPIGLATNVFNTEYYEHLVRSWPDESMFGKMQDISKGYNKLSLAEVNNRKEEYSKVVNGTYPWRAFWSFIKDPWFVDYVFSVLAEHQIKLHREEGFKYKARFEFSSLPSNGGFIRPHRDIPQKVVTLILPMTLDTTLQGGGTEVLRPKYKDREYGDYKSPLEDFDRVERFPFVPNNCVIFIRNENSWHSVGPLDEPGNYRRSLTVNIEKFSVKV